VATATLLELATRHHAARASLAEKTTLKALKTFRHTNLDFLDVSWTAIAPFLVADVKAAQLEAAQQAIPYMTSVADAYGGSPKQASLVPEAFTGVTLDGRELAPAMFGAITETKTLIGKGWAPERAFETGAAFLATVVKTAVADMGRQADNTLSTGKGWTHYIRVISAGACSRCAILAGSSSNAKPFKRHPNCKCTAIPENGERTPEGFFHGPNDYFESLSPAEQDRVFTEAGAFAIRNGADPIQVVNARRGAYGIGYNARTVPGAGRNQLQKLTIGKKANGSPLQVYATTEGTTARGRFGRGELSAGGTSTKGDGERYRRSTTLRLMPEQIQIMAGDNPARARELLQRYGYLD